MEKRLERKTPSNVEQSINTDDVKTATVESNLLDTVHFEKVGNESSKAKSLVTSDKHSSENMCLFCFRSFKSKGGLTRHTKSCKMLSKVKESSDSEDITLTSVTETQCNTNEIIESPSSDTGPVQIQSQKVCYKWGQYPDYIIERKISAIYEKIVHWRKNLFMLPRGNAGKRYIDEITRLMGAWINDSPMKNIVFKAIMVMPNLLLQKPSKQSKAKDHLNALDRRINLWISGDLEELVLEGETIQKCLKSVIDQNLY